MLMVESILVGRKIVLGLLVYQGVQLNSCIKLDEGSNEIKEVVLMNIEASRRSLGRVEA